MRIPAEAIRLDDELELYELDSPDRPFERTGRTGLHTVTYITDAEPITVDGVPHPAIRVDCLAGQTHREALLIRSHLVTVYRKQRRSF